MLFVVPPSSSLAAYSVFFSLSSRSFVLKLKNSLAAYCFCSPAGRCGLRAVMVFVQHGRLIFFLADAMLKDKNTRQPLCSTLRSCLTSLPTYAASGLFVPHSPKLATPLLRSQAARDAWLLPITLRSTVSSQPFSSRLFFLLFLPAGKKMQLVEMLCQSSVPLPRSASSLR